MRQKQVVRHPELSKKLYAALESKSQRDGKKYSIFRLAKAVNRDYGHINRVMHGQSAPSRDILIDVCNALECSEQEQKEIFHELNYLTPSEKENDPSRSAA